MEDKLKRLDFLLSKSTTYSTILAQRLKESQIHEQNRRNAATKSTSQPSSSKSKPKAPASPVRKGKKRAAEVEDPEEEPDAKRAKVQDTDEPTDPSTTLEQPPFITMPLREYQLHGVQWSE